jgi:predicted CoA-substrate-specific enzyme activase
MNDAVAIGVDAGSTTWKAVAIDERGNIVARLLEKAHPRIEEQTVRALSELRQMCGSRETVPVGATGYGRKRVEAVRTLTEITCHAKGAYRRAGRAGALIDVGGQDTKVIRIDQGGAVVDFAMNDKCAAGTGRFLEVIFDRLGLACEEVEATAAGAARAVPVSSTCTVFAESEVVSLVAQGEPVAGILKGLHQSLCTRVAGLAGRLTEGAAVFMSGGVALNPVMVDMLSETLGQPVTVLPDPQFIGALGAALSLGE